VKRALVLGVVAAVALVAGWRLTHPAPPSSVTLSAESAASARQKAQEIATAEARAQSTGRPVAVEETFSDSELSSLANQEAQDRELPFDQIVLHVTSRGTIQGQATSHVGGQDLPVAVEGVPEVSGDRVRLRITRTSLGGVPVPRTVADQLSQQVGQNLEFGQSLAGFDNLSVTTAEGHLTVQGRAIPS
jgi:hypothetical protein